MQGLLLGRDMCGERREVIGYRLWAIGYRREAIGYFFFSAEVAGLPMASRMEVSAWIFCMR